MPLIADNLYMGIQQTINHQNNEFFGQVGLEFKEMGSGPAFLSESKFTNREWIFTSSTALLA
jgi:hypothetical protein